jgi:hypothetical protein
MLGLHRHPVCYMIPWHLSVLTLPKALTVSDTPASTPSDTAWEGHVFPPVQLIGEPQCVSSRLSSTNAVLTMSPS